MISNFIRLALSLLLTTTFTSATAPSLTSIRSSLSVLEDSIVHSLLSLSSISESTSLPTIDQLQSIYGLTFNETFNSQVPSSDFISKSHPAFPPYLLYQRGNGSKFGDNSTHDRTESMSDLYSFFEQELFNTTRSTNDTLLLPDDQSVVLLGSASFLSLLSSRIHLGISVAQAKFFSNQTDLCQLITKDDKAGIRTFITVQSQESLVKERVESKASAWSTIPIVTQDPSKPQLNETVEPDFDYMKARKLFESYLIPITSDVEVATLLGYKSECM